MLCMLMVWILSTIVIGVLVYQKCLTNKFEAFAVGTIVSIIPSMILGTIFSEEVFGVTSAECQYTKELTNITEDYLLLSSYPEIIYMVEENMYSINQKQVTVFFDYTDSSPYVEYWDFNERELWWKMPGGTPHYIFYLRDDDGLYDQMLILRENYNS